MQSLGNISSLMHFFPFSGRYGQFKNTLSRTNIEVSEILIEQTNNGVAARKTDMVGGRYNPAGTNQFFTVCGDF